jgi:hypothetical protein
VLGSSGGGKGLLFVVPCLDGNQKWTGAAKVRKVLFAGNRKERPHGVRNPGTSSPLGQVL